MSETEQKTETVELTPQTHEILEMYRQEDEDLSETLERLLSLVSHRVELPRGVDTSNLSETGVILERWPDADGVLQERMYGSPYEFVKRWAEATGFEKTESQQE